MEIFKNHKWRYFTKCMESKVWAPKKEKEGLAGHIISWASCKINEFIEFVFGEIKDFTKFSKSFKLLLLL